MLDGIVLLKKPKHITSFGCIKKLRQVLNVKKIGHTGTLDIDAQGLLVCLVGSACKRQNFLMNSEKEYIAELVIGIATNTEDITGEILDSDNTYVDKFKFENVIKDFLGTYMQTPPMFSSKKINGRKMLDYAKKGIFIERKPTKVEIKSIEILDEYEREIVDNKKYQCFKIKVLCGKGTYIRTLCKDIGEKLGVNSAMGELIRTRTSGFSIDDAFTIAEIKEKICKNDFSFIKNCLFLDKPQVVTFGKFETLHLGHIKLIKRVVEIAKLENIDSTVIIVQYNSQNNNFLSREQQLSIIKSYGINNVLSFDLNIENKNMSAKTFIDEILIRQVKAKKIIVGFDATIGKNCEFNAEDIKNYCFKKNVGCEVLNKIKLSDVLNEKELRDYKIEDMDETVSSTLVYKILKNKNYDLIEKILGRKVIRI